MSKAQILQSYELSEENLVPMYIIEDKLKQNFRKTNAFISVTKNNYENTCLQVNGLKKEQSQIREAFDKKIEEMERKITHEISLELDGKISIALGKNISSITEKFQKRENQMSDMSHEFDKKLNDLKSNLKYEVSQENQKFFSKEIKKLQEKIASNQSKPRKQSPMKKAVANEGGNENENWQAQHILIKELESRIERIEEFNVDLDKKFYSNMTSLKENWKEIGTEILQNKKSLNKKFDDLRLDFIKLKNLKQFQFAPEKVEEEFKKKLAEKFTDIYHLLSLSLTKNQFQSTTERIQKRITRHDDELMEVRKELSNNSQFFTFYMNNSDQDNLKKQIEAIDEEVKKNLQQISAKLQKMKENQIADEQNIKLVGGMAEVTKNDLFNGLKQITRINEVVSLFEGRVQSLEDFNRFGPDKLERIHNALDVGFSASEKELINNQNKKTYSSQVEQIYKDFKIETNKIKDQLFVLSSQTQIKDEEIVNLRKIIDQMENRIDKVKGETEEAMIARKPWVCLSCDKQEKQVKKEMKGKKFQPIRQGLGQKGSEKNLKLTNQQHEERFEVYEKFREKYLSDTVKLPEIYKEKIGEKDTSFH